MLDLKNLKNFQLTQITESRSEAGMPYRVEFHNPLKTAVLSFCISEEEKAQLEAEFHANDTVVLEAVTCQ